MDRNSMIMVFRRIVKRINTLYLCNRLRLISKKYLDRCQAHFIHNSLQNPHKQYGFLHLIQYCASSPFDEV